MDEREFGSQKNLAAENELAAAVDSRPRARMNAYC
jgi:hypothetical protein